MFGRVQPVVKIEFKSPERYLAQCVGSRLRPPGSSRQRSRLFPDFSRGKPMPTYPMQCLTNDEPLSIENNSWIPEAIANPATRTCHGHYQEEVELSSISPAAVLTVAIRVGRAEALKTVCRSHHRIRGK